MALKANLKVVLFANDVPVAEADDAALWQRTLSAITGSAERAATDLPMRNGVGNVDASLPEELPRAGSANGLSAIGQFAAELRLESAVVEEACEPSEEPPYMRLDERAWRDFRKKTGASGRSSIPPIILPATLLVIWFKHAKLGQVSVSQAQSVLKTIGERDKNVTRAMRNCGWLRVTDDIIKLRPGGDERAIAVARAFCTHQAVENEPV